MHTSVAIGAFLLSAPAIAMPAGAPGSNTVTELEAETPAIGIHWSNEVQRGGDEMTIKLDNKTFITSSSSLCTISRFSADFLDHTFAATGFQANWNLDNCCFHGDDGEIKPTPIAPGSGSFNNYQISPPQIIRNVTCNEKPIENGNVFFVLTYENWGPPQALEVPHDGTAPNGEFKLGSLEKGLC